MAVSGISRVAEGFGGWFGDGWKDFVTIDIDTTQTDADAGGSSRATELTTTSFGRQIKNIVELWKTILPAEKARYGTGCGTGRRVISIWVNS